jgi:hypothetical protein
LTETVELNADSPVHSELSGPNRSNTIVPVGENPPESVAVSLIVPPAVTDPEAFVEIVVLALVTVTVSPLAPHALVTATLLASPLYAATHW